MLAEAEYSQLVTGKFQKSDSDTSIGDVLRADL